MPGAAHDEATATAKKPEASATTWISAIPSVYYDLIARVCPGMAFLAALYVNHLMRVNGHPLALADLSGPLLVVLLALSYAVGMVLTGISFFWDVLCIGGLCLSSQLRRLFGLEPPIPSSFFARWATVSLRIDGVTKEDAAAGTELSKMMAEVALCQNLFSGALMLFVFAPCLLGWLHIALAVLLCWAMLIRQAMFLGRVYSLYRVYG